MSERTKLILAITLGSLGVALGLLATIVAFNAREEVDSDQQVSRQVDERFAEAQAKQDRREKEQASEAWRMTEATDNRRRSTSRGRPYWSRSAR